MDFCIDYRRNYEFDQKSFRIIKGYIMGLHKSGRWILETSQGPKSIRINENLSPNKNRSPCYGNGALKLDNKFCFWLYLPNLDHWIIEISTKEHTRGILKCPKKHLKDVLFTWCHMHYFFKCPKFEYFDFRFISRFKTSQVFFLRNAPFFCCKKFWNGPFFLSYFGNGKNGAFQKFFVLV